MGSRDLRWLPNPNKGDEFVPEYGMAAEYKRSEIDSHSPNPHVVQQRIERVSRPSIDLGARAGFPVDSSGYLRSRRFQSFGLRALVSR